MLFLKLRPYALLTSVHIVQYHETSAVVPPLVALLHFRAQHKWLTMLALSPAVKMVKMGGYQYE